MRRNQLTHLVAIILVVAGVFGMNPAFRDPDEYVNRPLLKATASTTASPVGSLDVARNPTQSKDSLPGPESVTVNVLEGSLDINEEQLFGAFANGPEAKQFRAYTTSDWQKNYDEFSASLQGKAKAQGFDEISLGQILKLKKSQSEDTAYLPVGAYSCSVKGTPAWIVVFKWEYESMGEGSVLGHIEVVVYETSRLKPLASARCS